LSCQPKPADADNQAGCGVLGVLNWKKRFAVFFHKHTDFIQFWDYVKKICINNFSFFLSRYNFF